MKYLSFMLRPLLRSLLLAILLIGSLAGPVPVAFATGMGSPTGDQPMTMAHMPSMEMLISQAGGDCCKTSELPPADCVKTCPMAFSCLSQCFTATAADTIIHILPAATGVVIWPLHDRHRSRLPTTGPYEPPRA
ncbi:MAG: hypothetical protein ABIQ30_07575 [Devosia sp.]